MEWFHIDGDNKRLYFRNIERKSDEKEFEEIVSALKREDCRFENNIMGPDCDLIRCKINNMKFDLIKTIDGDGSFLYCEDINTMHELEKYLIKDNITKE